MHIPTIPVHHPSLFVKMCMARGYNIEKILENTNIKIEDLNDSKSRFNLKQTETLISNALKVSNDPTLSIAYSQHIRLSHLGTLGIAILNAPKFSDVIYVLNHFLSIVDPAALMHVVLEKSIVSIQFGKKVPLGMNYKYVQETLCLTMIKVFEDILETQLPELKIYFDFDKPTYAEKFKFLDAPIFWEQDLCKITFNAKILEKDLPGANHLAFQQAFQMCELELQDQSDDEAHWLVKVKLLVLENIRSPLTAEEIAELLHLSRRTFFRKLAKYQMTYDKLLVMVRAEVAKEYLMNKSLNLEEITDLLGYSNVSSFSKAFKRWYGVTPYQWYSTYRSRKMV